MIDQIFNSLALFEDFVWVYLGFPTIMLLGLYFTFKSGFVQIRKFPLVFKIFASFMNIKEHQSRGVHPLKAFFACVGGCVGVGNIIAICTAVQVGGPGALFWIWVTAIVGMILKYCEVYLGIKYRVPNEQGGYNGGPMYFLTKVFKNRWVPSLTALLLCIYGVEIFQFSVVVRSVSYNWEINPLIIALFLLVLVLFAGSGGVRRVGTIASAVIPIFVLVYMGMGGWILANNLSLLPEIIASVFKGAFSGHAAVGGFVGSTLLVTISQGIRRGCYTGDVGVGYASIINSETSIQSPQKQALLEFLGIFLDTFLICTTSVLLILVTGVWQDPMDVSLLVQQALGQYFPFMPFFMPFFLFLLGYSTINAYFCAGLKCAEYLSPRRGKLLYNVYGAVSLILFSFGDLARAQSVMAIAGGLLLVINVYGMFRLRHEISFDVSEIEEKVPAVHSV